LFFQTTGLNTLKSEELPRIVKEEISEVKMGMGLSEDDKKRIPYYQELQKEEERKRYERFLKSPEYVEIADRFCCAFEDHLHQRLKGYLKARDIKKPTVGIVVALTNDLTRIICDDIVRTIPHLTEMMLERFDLVKKKKV
jgi:hypothetical protein